MAMHGHERLAGALIALAITATLPAWTACGRQGASGLQPEDVTSADVRRWMDELSNWGRWGADDQLGALNLITPEKRVEALRLATEGVVVSMSRQPRVMPTSATPEGERPDNAFWQRDFLIPRNGIAIENISIFQHGVVHTHMDALCHFGHEGQLYNGVVFDEVVNTETGCTRMGIDNIREGIITRGVLLDIPRLKGVPYLEPGYAVTPEEILAWEEQAGVRVGPGDVVLLHTGRWLRPPPGDEDPTAGWHPAVTPWFKERDVAVMGSDGSQDAVVYDDFAFPVHVPALVALGVHVIDAADLTAVAETAAELGRWEFLFMAAPLQLPGNTGSPFDPLAIF